MPLFVCDQCRAVESTATSTFSRQLQQRAEGQRDQLLCSECESGTWHGIFPKQIATRAFLCAHRHDFLYLGGLTPGEPASRG